MQVDVSIVIAICSFTWSAGLFMGLLTARFVSKKECEQKNRIVWDRIDAISDCMTGGKIVYELRMVKKDNA